MRLPEGTSLDVSLAFGTTDVFEAGRLGIADRSVIFEQKRSFVASRLALHPLFPSDPDRVIRPANPRTFDGLHGVFSDSLPDAWGRELLRRRARTEGIDYHSLTALDRLALIGTSGPGALSYRPPIDAFDLRDPDVDLDVLAEDALAVLTGDEPAHLDQLVRLGGSSGGARPKISVAMNDRGAVRPMEPELHDGYEPWIVKFRAPNDPTDAGPVEAAYADMARACGLTVAETRLLPSRTGPGYFATKRFDRVAGRRMHMVSAAAMLEADWTIPGEYETLFKLTRRVTRDQKSVEAIFRRAVFNHIACNRDDHWKQHAFLMGANGAWTVAPSFDLTFSPGPSGEHYLTIAGRGKKASVADFARAGVAESIDGRDVRAIVDQVIDAVSRYGEFASNRGSSATSIRTISRTLSARLR